MRRKKCRGIHATEIRWVEELNRYCQRGNCIICGEWFSLGYADEPAVDVRAATIDQDRMMAQPPLVSHAEESGMASRQRWYACWTWDAGWLARAIEEHDAIQRDDDPPTETQQSISAWANTTFGAPDTNLSIAERADKEMRELRRKLEANDADPSVPEEAADIAIVLMRLFERHGTELQFEIDKKMAINRARKWRLTGGGHGQHIDETEVELRTGPEPELGVRVDVAPLPPGSHDHVDCPCDHPPGEVGPCGGCNCADDDGTLAPHPTDGMFGRADGEP